MSPVRRLVSEIHRRSLWQVLGIYAVASWAVYQVVLGLYEGVGLPDWVPTTAIVLLLLGLPIVLATAFVQEGPPPLGARGGARDRLEDPAPPAKEEPAGPAPAHQTGGYASTSATANRTSRQRPLLLSWPRAITGGVLAFAALGLAASGFMGMRALGIGPAATLVSSGVLAEREPILLTQLGSASGDTVLASAVTEALRVDLETSPVVTLVQTSQVQDALRRMRREPAAPLTEELAVEIALREGIRAILVGDVTAAGDQYVLTARLIAPDGASLASVRQTASGDAVIAAADRLSAALRERLGESFKSIRSAEPLAQVTTPSLEALRKYSQGVRAHDGDPDPRKAIVLLQQALAEDSAFAMAWRKLGVAYQHVSGDSMRIALERAYRHRDRLSERERYLTEGTYHQVVSSDTARAMVAYEALLELHPNEPTALNNLALLHSGRGDLEKAAELYGRKIAVDPTAVTMRNQVYALTQLKRLDEVEALLDLYEERYPDHFQGPQFRGALAAHHFDYDAARPLFERAQELNEDVGQFALGSMLLIEGQHARALRAMRDALGDDPERLEAELAFTSVALLVFHRFNPGAALQDLERFLTPDRLRTLPVDERPYFELAMLGLLTDDVAAAERWRDRWREERPDDFEPLDGQARDLTVEVAAANGDPQPAIRLYRRQGEAGCLDCWFHLGRIQEGAGMSDSAIVAYETYLAPPRPPLFRVNTDRWFLPGTLQRLAALHEEAGNTGRAAAHYARFIDLWQDADPELQPRVEAARRALTRLTGEGR